MAAQLRSCPSSLRTKLAWLTSSLAGLRPLRNAALPACLPAAPPLGAGLLDWCWALVQWWHCQHCQHCQPVWIHDGADGLDDSR